MLPPNKIREKRKALGLSQKAMADRIGTSQQSFRKWEAGEQEPLISTALRIANILKSTIEELFPDVPVRRKAKKKGRKAR